MFALIDCNNFYVSCERVFDPKLINRPVIILSNNDGCVIARSDEAKQIGIKMAQPAFFMTDFLKKNNVSVLSSNYVLYGDMSYRVFETIKNIINKVEVYSIDEMFLDMKGYHQSPLYLAKHLKYIVQKHTGIPVSVGVAPTKTLAKIANHIAKSNNGICILENSEEIKTTLENFPINEVWGIGEQISKALKKWGLSNAWQLRCLYDKYVHKTFSIVTLRTVYELRGISCIPMKENPPSQKNICIGRSFGSMTSNYHIVKEAIANFSAKCAEKLRNAQLVANSLSVFIETNPFRNDLAQHNQLKTITMRSPTNNTPEIIKYANFCLDEIIKQGFLYKKAGVMGSGLEPSDSRQQCFFNTESAKKNDRIMETIDKYNQKNGRDTIRLAAMGFERKWWLRQEKLSKRYTTQWEEVITIHN